MGQAQKLFACLLGVIAAYYYLPSDFFGTLHAETHLDFEDYVQYFNYPVERHEIVTQDGYILTCFRIQAKHQQSMKDELPVVYLQHGLLDSSDTFIVNSEHNAPAFILANRGYDVWLGNFRGNKHSRRHVRFQADSEFADEESRFWDFSFHEMGTMDIPAICEYIHSLTHQRIHFIGHSQGSMAMFVSLSTESSARQLAPILSQVIALGPIAYISNVSSVPLVLYNFVRQYIPLYKIVPGLGFKEFIPTTWFSEQVISRACNVLPLMCSYAYGLFGSLDPLLDQNDRYDVISAHIPAGTSLKNMLHFHQLISTHEFKAYDLGERQNIEHYGQSTPPMYDLGQIEVPMALFVGSEDRLATQADIDRLKGELVRCTDIYYEEIHSGHTSFMWGKNMTYFEKVIRLIQSNSNDSSSHFNSSRTSNNTVAVTNVNQHKQPSIYQNSTESFDL